MKILSIVDKPGSAIDRLAKMTALRLPHHNIKVLSFHPKRPSEQEIIDIRREIEDADLLDFQYWKSAVAVIKRFPEFVNGKKSVLTHHNEHNINGDWEWKNYKWDAIVAKNGWQKQQLEVQGYSPILIRHAIEFDNFGYIQDLTKEKVVGYVGQIKKVKGVRELYQACHELGYKLLIVGAPSEADYYNQLFEEGMKNGDLFITSKVPDNELKNFYHQMRVYCANSDDGTESGTMPILEAMLSGIPVVSRKIGLVRDVGQHGENIYVNENHYTHIESLKVALQMVMENDDIAEKIRENAWRSVRQYHPDVQAREYDRLFRRVSFPSQQIVSVIMPTHLRTEILRANLLSLNDQTYKNFEVVVCDDSDQDYTTQDLINELRANNQLSYPLKYVRTDSEGYGLAKARNLGILEAVGDILVFCDDRLKMHNSALAGFINKLKQTTNTKIWLWGSKGVVKSFVENFSCSYRQAVINGGMFCERIDSYGGMTQEVSHRFAAQGFEFVFAPEAVAESMLTTHSKSKHRSDIIKQKVRLYKMGLQ